MKAWSVRAHGLREMLRLLRRRPGSFVLAVLLAGSAFALPLAGASIAHSWATLRAELPLGAEINLFLAPATPAEETRQLQLRLAARAGVAGVEWITRESALIALAQRSGNSHLGELKSNPLPDVLVVRFTPDTEPAVVEKAAVELRSLPRVEGVAADVSWYRKLASLVRLAKVAALMLAVLALALIVLIVLGAVRLQLATARDDLRVLRLVGADDRFIVRPFAYAGALTLACGFALAAALVAVGLAALAPDVAELSQLYALPIEWAPLPLEWLAALAAGAATLGGLTGALGARWALRASRQHE